MSLEATYRQGFANPTVSLIAANSTLAKILVDTRPAQQLAAIAGESTLPGEATTRPRVLWGGAICSSVLAASTDAADKDVIVFVGDRKTPALASGALTGNITGTNTINRTDGGSFLTDGWAIGDSLMLFGETSVAGNNGLLVQVTNVAAAALTLNGALLTNTAAFTGTPRLFRVSQRLRVLVKANSGNTNTLPNVTLLGNPLDKSADALSLKLGENSILAVAASAAVSALPARIDVSAEIDLY